MARINKQNSPSTIKSWVEYYKALEDNPHKKFRGCCSREIFNSNNTEKTFDTWQPIIAYFKFRKSKLENKKDIFNYHPWATPNRSEWNTITGLELVNQSYANSPKWKKSYDKKLLTPHHLISCCVTQAINRHWKKIIENEIGYNVNSAHNLVILTNSAEIACHLRIPLHEGGHSEGHSSDYIPINEYNNYSKMKGTLRKGGQHSFWEHSNQENLDELQENKNEIELVEYLNKHMILKAYHSKVFKYVTLVLRKHFEGCPSDLNDTDFIIDMNKCSKRILNNLKRFDWVLSPTGKDYNPDSSKGCCGVKVISTYGLDPEERENQKLKITDTPLPDCKENRNHDYLNQIFNIKRLDIKSRKKKGLVVASQLKY